VISLEKEVMVKGIFKSINTKYDFFDFLMSFGMDRRWRKFVIDKLDLRNGMTVEDVGAGSGKVTEGILKRYTQLIVEAVDLTKEMFPKPIENVHFTVASAEHLPFENENFDRCVSCFLTRNLQNLQNYLNESYRTLKNGGIFCNMDIYDPGVNFIAPAFRIYFYKIMPRIMNRASRTEAYSYLANSVKNFVSPDRFSEMMKISGYKNIQAFKLGGGSVYVHKGIKE
jgi:demethylmenaquinone methyltransferase/2-methoxy-6-polyprenyl-1,4-benzoquinol methylase